MEIVFKYEGDLINENIRQLTKSLVGYSRINDKPIYNIEFNINKELIKDLLFDEFDRGNHVENIKLFLRRFKAIKLSNGAIDQDMDKFATFMQYYSDNINDVIVMKQSN